MVDRDTSNFQAEATVCIKRIAGDILNGHAIGNNDLETVILFNAGVAKRVKIKVSVTP
jgi:hypothetical protein